MKVVGKSVVNGTVCPVLLQPNYKGCLHFLKMENME